MMLSSSRRGRRNDDLPGGYHRQTTTKTVSVFGRRIPRKHVVGALGFVGAVALLGPDPATYTDVLRRALSGEDLFATRCVKNVYVATPDDAVLMPPVPERETPYVPTSIQLCYEWLRRDALGVDPAAQPKAYVTEHRDVCLDWSAPHYALMEMISSSVIQNAVGGWSYVHGCSKHREHDEAIRGFDWATLQTAISEAVMAPNPALIDPYAFIEQCKACVGSYNTVNDEERIRGKALHHCFAFPEDSTQYNDPPALFPVTEPTVVNLPSEPQSSGNLAPISSVVNPVRSRLQVAAVAWGNVTDSPPDEPESGTVILIDDNTMPVDPTVLNQFIDPATTSINVLAGPTCYFSTLPNGELCADYGQRIVDGLAPLYPLLSTNGYGGGPGVDFQISASTAATISRATNADDLLCPPDTIECLLPAMAKPPPKKSKVLEAIPCPDCPGAGTPATKFFDKVGTNDNTDVIQLPDDALPPVTPQTVDPPTKPSIPPSPPGFPLPPQFPAAQEPTSGDGYPSSGAPPPPAQDPQTVAATPSADAYKDVEPQLPPEVAAASTGDPSEPSPMEQTPNLSPATTDTEKVPSPEDVDAAVANNEPLDTNTPAYNPEGAEDEPVDPTTQTELATDESTSLLQRDITDEDYEELAQERKDSTARIVKGGDGTIVYEVPCPTVDDTGNTFSTDDGYVLHDNGDTVDIGDGAGFVTMESPVTVTNVETELMNITDPITGDTTEEEVFPVQDTRLNETIYVQASSGVTTNPDSSLEIDNTVGMLVTDTETQQCMLVTEGESKGNKGKGKGNNKKTHTVIEGTCVSAGQENVPVSDSGALTMAGDGGLAVTQQSTGGDTEAEFLPVDPDEGNMGDYQTFQNTNQVDDVLQIDTTPLDRCLTSPVSPPIMVHPDSQIDGTSVAFDVYQTWKSDTISWVAASLKDDYQGGSVHCMKMNEVPPDMPPKSLPLGPVGSGGQGSGYYPPRKATCVGGYADVDLFIHDGSKKVAQANEDDWITQHMNANYAGCEPSQDFGNKCWFKYRVKCTPPARRRRLTGQEGQQQMLLPATVKVAVRDDQDSRILFARNILQKCPELDKGRVYDRFKFGGGAQRTNVNTVNNGAVAMQ